jgi:hypothetical protein
LGGEDGGENGGQGGESKRACLHSVTSFLVGLVLPARRGAECGAEFGSGCGRLASGGEGGQMKVGAWQGVGGHAGMGGGESRSPAGRSDPLPLEASRSVLAAWKRRSWCAQHKPVALEIHRTALASVDQIGEESNGGDVGDRPLLLIHLVLAAVGDVTTSGRLILLGRSVIPIRRLKGGAVWLH